MAYDADGAKVEGPSGKEALVEALTSKITYHEQAVKRLQELQAQRLLAQAVGGTYVTNPIYTRVAESEEISHESELEFHLLQITALSSQRQAILAADSRSGAAAGGGHSVATVDWRSGSGSRRERRGGTDPIIAGSATDLAGADECCAVM